MHSFNRQLTLKAFRIVIKNNWELFWKVNYGILPVQKKHFFETCVVIPEVFTKKSIEKKE